MVSTPPRPDISVVIPTFQCGHFVSQAIDSVLAQTCPEREYEVIVVDDGSTDETAAVAARYGQKIRYLYQQNQGVAAARNAGIAIAGGAFVAFLDADDYWLPDRLRVLSPQLYDGARQIVTTDFFVSVDEKTSDTANYREHQVEWLFDLDPAAQLRIVVESNLLSYMMVVPRRLFDEVGTFDETLHYGEDWDLWLRCLAAGYPVRLVREAQAVYRLLRPGSSTTRNDYSKAKDRVRVLERHRNRVSRRRWEMAVGIMDHEGFKSSLQGRHYGRALHHAAKLAINPIYVRQLLARRRDRGPRADG